MPTQNEALLEAYASCPPSARMYPTDCDTFAAWLKTTLNNGTARFTMNVWLGTALVNKVCQSSLAVNIVCVCANVPGSRVA